MLKIGEFSTLTGISISMLRNYDRMGLLQPAVTDESSNYRYYEERQEAEAKRIQMFKELGFSLKEIPMLNAFSPAEVQYLISQKIVEKQAELSRLQEQLLKMKQAKENYELCSSHSFAITRTRMPSRKVLSARINLRRIEEEQGILEELLQKCRDNEVEVIKGEPVYAITHSSDYIYSCYNIEIQIPAARPAKLPEGFEYLDIAPLETAEVNFDGTEEELIQVNKFVGRYAGGLGYQILGAPYRNVGVLTGSGLKSLCEDGHQTYYYPISKLY